MRYETVPIMDSTMWGECDTQALNSLLRGEISAVDSYNRAIDAFSDHPVAMDFESIRDDHEYAINAIRERVWRFGGTPAEEAGMAGDFAVVVTGDTNATPLERVLTGLRQAEQHAIEDYETALENPHITDDCKEMIDGNLIVRCRKHVGRLDHILQMLQAG